MLRAFAPGLVFGRDPNPAADGLAIHIKDGDLPLASGWFLPSRPFLQDHPPIGLPRDRVPLGIHVERRLRFDHGRIAPAFKIESQSRFSSCVSIDTAYTALHGYTEEPRSEVVD